MTNIEQRIRRTHNLGPQATVQGFALGTLAGLAAWAFGLGSWFACLYLGLAVWFTVVMIPLYGLARERGWLRPIIGALIGAAVFAVTLSRTSGLLSFFAPPALAFLAVEVVFNQLVYLFNPVARYDDQIQLLIISPEAQSRPSATRTKIEDLQKQRLQKLRRQFEAQLTQAERTPTTASAGRVFSRLVEELSAVSTVSKELGPLLGRALVGLAQNQTARGDAQAANTVKRAQNYPLPPSGVDFIAQHYATRKESGPDAIKAFLAYIRARKDRLLVLEDPVCLAARAICAVSPADSEARLKEVETRAQAFFEADSRLGWAALLLGQSLLWQGHPRKALAHLEKAAELMPSGAEPAHFIGRANLALKNTNVALDAFRRALTLDPHNLESMYWLGYTLVADGRAEDLSANRRASAVREARKSLEQVAAAQPKRAEVYYALGLTALAAEEHAAARQQFEKALSLDAASADWHYHYARTLVALEDFGSAIAAVRQAVSRTPDHRPARLLLGRELLRARQWTEAEANYRTLLAADANDAEAKIGLGQTLFEHGRPADAVECLQSVPEPTRDSLYYLGRALAMRDEFQQSRTAYEQAISTFGPDAALCYALGCAQAHLRKWKTALAAFEQSLTFEDSGKTHIQLGHVHLAQGERAAALAEYRKALEVSPQLPEAHHALGLYDYGAGKLDEAECEFTQAAQLAGDGAPAYVGLGVILEARGDWAGALEKYQQAIVAGGSRPELSFRRGVVASKQKKYEEALALLTEARQAGVESDELLYNLGLAHAQLSHWAEALEAWLPLQQRAPRDERLGLNVARCQYQLGHQRFGEGNFAAAAQAWEACAGVYGEDENLNQALAEAHFRHGLELLRPAAHGQAVSPEAKAAFQRAREAGGDDEARIDFFQALAALAEGDHKAATRALCQLHKADDSDGRALYHLGFALRHAGQPDQAVPFLERALQTELPSHLRLGANLILAEAYSAAQRWPDAARMYRAALEV